MSEPAPLALEKIVDQVRAAVRGARIEAKLAARGAVSDPRAVERVVRDLLLGVAGGGKQITIESRDLLRDDERGRRGRWTEVLVLEPPGAGADGARTRASALLLTARARLGAALLIGGAGAAPVLDVSSTSRGTALRLLFPCASAGGAGRPVVLLVDDDDTLRQAASERLREAGYAVISAPSGEVALARATEPVDVLVTDLVMPTMSGTELARQLLQRWPGCKVLIMSAIPVQPGMYFPAPFISKPLDIDLLLVQLPSLLAGLLPGKRPVAV